LTEDLGAGGRVLSAHSCNGRQQPENEGLRMSPCLLESGDSFDLPFPLFLLGRGGWYHLTHGPEENKAALGKDRYNCVQGRLWLGSTNLAA